MNVPKRSQISFLFFIIAGELLSSCITTSTRYSEVQLPAFASGLFVDCSSTSGALTFQLKRLSQDIDSLDLEWAAKQGGDWAVASYSPIGQTLFQVSYSRFNQRYEVSGRKSQALTDLNIHQNGFLYYRGVKIGLRPEYFPCFFAGRLPRSWLKQITGFSQDSAAIYLEIQDNDVHTMLRLARHGSDTTWTWQFVSKWKIYFGLQEKTVSLQNRRDALTVMSSEDFDNIEFLWKVKEEE